MIEHRSQHIFGVRTVGLVHHGVVLGGEEAGRKASDGRGTARLPPSRLAVLGVPGDGGIGDVACREVPVGLPVRVFEDDGAALVTDPGRNLRRMPYCSSRARHPTA